MDPVVLPEWPPQNSPAVKRAIPLLRGMELDPNTLASDDLCHLLLEIFTAAGLPQELADDLDRVRRLILAVRDLMFDNAYHNFAHVFDVTQTSFAIAHKTGMLARMTAWERTALLVAALCHDLEHPGVSSVFLSKVSEDLSSVYKTTHLEKHHAQRCLELLVDTNVGLLAGISAERYWAFRNDVYRCILATDISRHSQFIASATASVAALREDPAAEVDTKLAMELIIKCADISNVLKPFPIMRRWGLRVTDEFFTQGDAELFYAMEVTPCMDRRTQGRVALQKGFIDFLCTPFFNPVAALFPAMARGVKQMNSNRARWGALPDDYLELVAVGGALPCGGVGARAFEELGLGAHPKDEDEFFRTTSLSSLAASDHSSLALDPPGGAPCCPGREGAPVLPVGLVRMVRRKAGCVSMSYAGLAPPGERCASASKAGPGTGTPLGLRGVAGSGPGALPWPVLQTAASSE